MAEDPARVTVDGSAAIDSAISALAPLATLYAKLSSLRASTLNTALPSHSVAAETPHALPTSELPTANNNHRCPAALTYAEVAVKPIPGSRANPLQLIRARPDRANRQTAALFHVPDPGRIEFLRLRFCGVELSAPIANMAILRRALADCNYRSSSVLISLEDSSIIVGIRKNTIAAFENAITKVVRSFSIAIPGLSFELQTDFNWFATDAPTALQQKSIRAAVSKELTRLDLMAREWKSRPFFVSALRSFAGITSSISPEQSGTDCAVSVEPTPFCRKRTVRQENTHNADDNDFPLVQRPRLEIARDAEFVENPHTARNACADTDMEMKQ